MRHVSPPYRFPLDEEWTRPLDGVARALVGVRRFRYFDLGDFMIMGKEVRRGRPDVYLYKHRYTRRYVNLDEAGHAYRYIGPRSLDSNYEGRYVRRRSLRDALDHLELWLLPWMKPGLEAQRFGLTFEQRWLLRPDVVGDDSDEVIAAMVERELDEIEEWNRRYPRIVEVARAAMGADMDGTWGAW